MALILFKSCLSRGIISIRKNILRIAKKIWRVFSWKPRHPIKVSKWFERRKFQNIILSVAGSDVIEKITLKYFIIYESKLFLPTWICLDWIPAKSAILKILETTWVSRKIYRFFRCLNQNAQTSVQITFLTNLTGIFLFLTYNQHEPCKKVCVIFWKNPLILKLSYLYCGLAALWK